MQSRPRYKVGDRVVLHTCPDVGTIVDIRCEVGVNTYRADWDGFPRDHKYYREGELVLWEGGEDAGVFQVG